MIARSVAVDHAPGVRRGARLGSGAQPVGQHLAVAAARRVAGAEDHQGADRNRLPRQPARDRDHRKLAVRQSGAGAVDRRQPQEPGRPPGARRFRHRLFVAWRICARCRSTGSRSTRASSCRSIDNAESAAIVNAIVRLGESLNLPITAEGVEDAGDRGAAAALGCAKGQGYSVRPSDAASPTLARRAAAPSDRLAGSFSGRAEITSPDRPGPA